MKGNVKWFDSKRGIGFIKGPDGQDRFFRQRELPKGLVPGEGDEVEFTSNKGPKGFFATRITLVAAAGQKPAESTKVKKTQAEPEAKEVASPPPKGVGISIIALDERTEGDNTIVPVWALVKEDGNPVIGTKVELSAKGSNTIEPKAKLDTDETGKVIFYATFPKDLASSLFLVRALRKEVSAPWEKGKGIVTDAPVTALGILDLQVKPAPAPEWMVFDIAVTAAKKLVTAEIGITIRPLNGSVLSVREAGSPAWERARETIFPCKGGRLTVQVRIAQLPAGLAGDDVVFGIEGQAVQSQPFYISGIYLVPRGAEQGENTQPTVN